MQELSLGRVAGLRVSALPSAGVGSLLLGALLTAVGVNWLKLPLGAALGGALLAVLLHWLSEVLHNLGHAWVARRAGYPMTGIRFWFLLGSSLYPPDEPPLPAAIHIRRALGGPALSFGVALVGGLLALLLRGMGGVAWGVALFFFLDNLLIFSLGALLPLGFNDGGTLVRWWGKA